jgi:UDP-2-acetamido-3-amino-2,3-dideoxy-glucuronate N-acetyltransferase
MKEQKFRLIETANIKDLRGNLTVAEFGRQIPFDPKRYFVIYQVPLIDIRGEHAHKVCHQFLICIRGSITAEADSGYRREQFRLDRPTLGLYMPPMTWGAQHTYSPDAMLLVFASHFYDKNDYIRDYDEFITLTKDIN